MLANIDKGPRITHIRSLGKTGTSLVIEGRVEGKTTAITVDTGAAVSLIKAAAIHGSNILPLTRKVVLQTVTGETADVKGETNVKIQLGNISLNHTWLT